VRVVSLIPSATEIVCALGFEATLVGRSHECDTPEGVERLPVCTSPKFSGAGRSRDIDRQVKTLVEQGLSVYRVDAEVLRELRPDLVLTQSQCAVCAASLRDVEEALAAWVPSRPRVVSLEPACLADVWRDIQRVAEALGSPERGERLVRELQQRMEAILRRASRLDHRPGVACIEWIEPLMACGNWVPELVERAGGRNLLGEAGRPSPWTSEEELCRSDPDTIFVCPCGFDLPRTRAEIASLAGRPGWAGLRAVQEGQVFLADGNRFFNRPGPRLVESLEILAEVLHPEEFHFGHEGLGWERA
jgi:iron complex transport system substrate-binding protein